VASVLGVEELEAAAQAASATLVSVPLSSMVESVASTPWSSAELAVLFELAELFELFDGSTLTIEGRAAEKGVGSAPPAAAAAVPAARRVQPTMMAARLVIRVPNIVCS
jgi:hypothetical protein